MGQAGKSYKIVKCTILMTIYGVRTHPWSKRGHLTRFSSQKMENGCMLLVGVGMSSFLTLLKESKLQQLTTLTKISTMNGLLLMCSWMSHLIMWGVCNYRSEKYSYLVVSMQKGRAQLKGGYS